MGVEKQKKHSMFNKRISLFNRRIPCLTKEFPCLTKEFVSVPAGPRKSMLLRQCARDRGGGGVVVGVAEPFS